MQCYSAGALAEPASPCAAGLFNIWFSLPVLVGLMLPGYLWQMPLNRGDCLQSIHGCCGMRLPHLLWSTLPKPFRSVVFLLTVSLIYQARLPILEYKYGQFNNLYFDIWNTLMIYWLWENWLILAPFCVLFSIVSLLHPLPSYLSLPGFSLPFSPCLTVTWTDLFSPVRQSYWESTRLYLTFAKVGPASWLWILCLGLPAHARTSCFLSFFFTLI